MAIKSAFEGPMNKTITFVVLDTKEVGMGSCNGVVHTTAHSGEWCVYFLCECRVCSSETDYINPFVLDKCTYMYIIYMYKSGMQ